SAGPGGLSSWASAQREQLERAVAGLKGAAGFESLLGPPSVAKRAPGPPPATARVPVERTGASSIIELFRAETVSCTEVLSRGLVELESGGRADLEGLMRA